MRIFSLKVPVKFQKDRHKTVGGVARTRCVLPIHFCGKRAIKISVKIAKRATKIISGF